MHQVRISNPSRIIFGQININSIRNKFEQLIYIVNNEIDILLISETKLDDIFPKSQFLMYNIAYNIAFNQTDTDVYSLRFFH